MTRLFFCLLIAIVLSSEVQAPTIEELKDESKEWFLFFHSPHCPHCVKAGETIEQWEKERANKNIILSKVQIT
jgi:thiol-disulfide isomerase/thioredoxin